MNRPIYSGIGSFAEGGSVPREMVIADQEHMLAYITPAEALMLKEAGGAGIPGPGGIPTFVKYGDYDNDGKADSLGDFFKDIMDGGGRGYSGARFGDRGGKDIDADGDKYISEKEYAAYEKSSPQGYKDHGNSISRMSNLFGARPRESYASERRLGGDGTNIGTTGIANYLTQGTMIGNFLMGGKPTSMSRAVPELGLNVPLSRAANSPPSTSLRPVLRPTSPEEKTFQKYGNFSYIVPDENIVPEEFYFGGLDYS